MRKLINHRLLAVPVAAALLATAACGSDDDASTTDAPAETSVATDAPAETAEPVTTEESATSGAGLDTEALVAAYDGPEAGLPQSYPEPEGGDITIGFLQPLAANETVRTLQTAVEGEADLLGATVVAYDAEGSPDNQVTQMEQLVNEAVDAIIVFPLDSNALAPSVQQAKEAGIPVIAVEANPTDFDDIGDYDTQIVQGRAFHAYVHATEMAARHPGGEVAVIGFAVPVPSIEAYVAEVLVQAEELGLVVVDDVDNQTDDVAGAEEVVNGLLASHPDLVGVLAYNDSSATGAGVAARGAGVELTTFGLNGESIAFESLASGREDLSVQFPVPEWGRQLVWAAYALADDPDADLPPTVFPSFPTVMTADNVDTIPTWDETIAEMYGS